MTGATGTRIDAEVEQFKLLEFPDRAEASVAAAGLVADSIRTGLDRQDRCSIVVSGGSTPGPCFDALSKMPLDWPGVTVIPSDERWVPPDHPDSNERLIRERLLVNRAASGQFLPLYRKGVEAFEAPPLIEQDLAALGTPLSCALLGMGEDGHFASLFPDFDGLEQGLDPASKALCMIVRTAGSPHVRVSLSLAFMLQSGALVLLIFGRAKRLVLETAATGNTGYPVESLLRWSSRSLKVVWAP